MGRKRSDHLEMDLARLHCLRCLGPWGQTLPLSFGSQTPPIPAPPIPVLGRHLPREGCGRQTCKCPLDKLIPSFPPIAVRAQTLSGQTVGPRNTFRPPTKLQPLWPIALRPFDLQRGALRGAPTAARWWPPAAPASGPPRAASFGRRRVGESASRLLGVSHSAERRGKPPKKEDTRFCRGPYRIPV